MRLFKFKTILAFSIILSLSLMCYVGWTAWEEYQSSVIEESARLVKYSNRLQTRIHASPNLRFSKNASYAKRPTAGDKTTIFTSSSMGFVSTYSELLDIVGAAPVEKDILPSSAESFNHKFSSLLKLPDFVLVMSVPVEGGKKYYAFRIVKQKRETEYALFQKVQPAISVTLICIFALVLVGFFHLSRINLNVREFEKWATGLQAGNTIPPPDFTSPKLNYIAQAIGENLNGISEALEKQQAFAKYTSHELRTPIAVLSANMEVLELIKKDMSPRERSLLSNMDSAISDMKYQMEALLWLCNEDALELPEEECCISWIVDKSLHDNAYLTEGNQVTIEVTGEALVVNTRPALIQIIVNNLVRNAFQNTPIGTLDVYSTHNAIVIENTSTVDVDRNKPMGFGLGTVIIEKLVANLGCGYTVEERKNGRKVTLTF
ncbi:MAG: signal transduction histidine kinase [Flavobacteriales bacterium]|jgi:signal transduction histidine kinase